MWDWKELMLDEAEKLSEEEHGKPFYDLPQDRQEVIYGWARENITEMRLCYADYLQKKALEG